MDWSETKAFLSPCFPEEMRAELELLYPENCGKSVFGWVNQPPW